MSLQDQEVVFTKKVLKLHDLWWGMNRRVSEYKRHTDKDIPLDPIWKGSVGRENFVLWSLSNGFKLGLQLDRIDGKKGYSPSNCQWIEAYENIVKDSRSLVYAGRKWCYTELSRSEHCHPSVNDKTLMGRIKLGWSLEEALTIPSSRGNRWMRAK